MVVIHPLRNFCSGNLFSSLPLLSPCDISRANICVWTIFYDNLGLQYSVGRIPIHSCDFSTHEYSYDDVDQDFSLQHFALAPEDFQYKVRHNFVRSTVILIHTPHRYGPQIPFQLIISCSYFRTLFQFGSSFFASVRLIKRLFEQLSQL